jgi:hypothetical protein
MKTFPLAAFGSIGGIALLSSMPAAHADEPHVYAGLAADYAFVDSDAYRDSGVTVNARGVFGMDVSRYFGAEAHVGIGVLTDDVVLKDPEEKAKLKLKNYYAVYCKGVLPIDSSMNVYGLLGFANTKTETSSDSGTTTDSGTDISYGLGVDVKFTDYAKVTVDGIMLHDKSGQQIITLSAGLKYEF